MSGFEVEVFIASSRAATDKEARQQIRLENERGISNFSQLESELKSVLRRS